MPRKPRECVPGSFHHVFNRGVGRRLIFDSDRDRRYFLSLLAGQVRRGRIELHAYTLLGNHYHLLVCAPRGELDHAMRDIGRQYSKGFNRTRDRDGPLFRARFESRRINDEGHLRNTLLYIDRNPVAAGLVARAIDHPFGSAHHFRHGTTPRWLSAKWVASVVEDWTGIAGLPPGLYGSRSLRTADAELVELVEAQMRVPGGRDAMGEIRSATDVVEWLRQRAWNADGLGDWLPLAAPSTVLRVCAAERASHVDVAGRRDGARWSTAEVGLLRQLAGCTLRESAARQATSESTARRRWVDHRERLRSDDAYADALRQVAAKIIAGLVDAS